MLGSAIAPMLGPEMLYHLFLVYRAIEFEAGASRDFVVLLGFNYVVFVFAKIFMRIVQVFVPTISLSQRLLIHDLPQITDLHRFEGRQRPQILDHWRPGETVLFLHFLMCIDEPVWINLLFVDASYSR